MQYGGYKRSYIDTYSLYSHINRSINKHQSVYIRIDIAVQKKRTLSNQVDDV
jgi:hypothetical protein